MSKMSSILQVLTVEVEETKFIDKDTGKPALRHFGRCILLDDAGAVVTVGRLRIPKPLVEQVKPGTFSASFALGVPDFGDNKGDIVAQLTGLVPVGKSAPAPAKAAA